MFINCSIPRSSSSPRGSCFSSKNRVFGGLGTFSAFSIFRLLGKRNEANDKLRPLENITRFAFSFLSNSFWSRTRLCGGVGVDLAVFEVTKGGVGTSLTIISWSKGLSLSELPPEIDLRSQTMINKNSSLLI